jgi:Uma2 family endonuclease
MRSGTIKRLFTVDDLYTMDRAGIFRNERVELIHGEVFRVMIGPRHAAAVERARDVFNRSLLGKVAVRSQNPIWIDEYNFPQPDVVVAKYRADYYESEYPRREDIFLLLEVSDSSIEHDREVKLALYAISKFSEYWIEDVSGEALLVFRDPEDDRYTTCLTLHRGETITPLAFPEIRLRVEDFLG